MMNCKQIISMIPDYLNDQLYPDELEMFLEHIDNCPECKEELSIQFLITEGLNTLNTGDSYDLQSAMNERVDKSHREIEVHNRLYRIRNFGVAAVIFVLMIVAAVVYFLYFK